MATDEALPHGPMAQLTALVTLYRDVLVDLVAQDAVGTVPETLERARALLTLDQGGEEALATLQRVIRLAALVEPFAATLAPDFLPWPWPGTEPRPESADLAEMLGYAAHLLYGCDEEPTDAWD